MNQLSPPSKRRRAFFKNNMTYAEKIAIQILEAGQTLDRPSTIRLWAGIIEKALEAQREACEEAAIESIDWNGYAGDYVDREDLSVQIINAEAQ